MRLIFNILWFLLGGFMGGLIWIAIGLFWCITVVGIPVGVQCFKFASMSFWPFGKQIVYGGGAGKFIVNVIWWFFGGFVMAAFYAVVGCIWCITIVGIPFGKQFFKLSRLAIMPFGSQIVKI